MNHKVLSAAILLCLAGGQAQAYDFISGGIAFKILSNTTTRKTAAVTYVTTNPDASGYVSTYKGNVIVPAQANWNFQTFNVTQIGDLAMFNNQALYTLRLPEGVTYIGSQAFSHCYSLYEVNIPTTVNRIADYAFEYCEDLKSITLPARLADFGDGVFQQCFGLERIDIDPECSEYKSIDGVMYGGAASPDGLTLLVYPGSRPETDYVMPDGVTDIDSYAFSANSTMRSLTLSKDLNKLDMLTFAECQNIEEVNVAEGNTSFCSDAGVLLSADGKRLVYYPLKRAADEYTVAEGVETIEALAFHMVQNLSSLTLPATLSHIGELAFYQGKSFRTITCMAAVPPSWSASSLVPSASLFDSSVYSVATLYVPDASVDAYRKASGWSSFKNILPLSSAAEAPNVADADDTTEYFDLNGRRLSNPAQGITVVRRGTTTVKQMMK